MIKCPELEGPLVTTLASGKRILVFKTELDENEKSKEGSHKATWFPIQKVLEAFDRKENEEPETNDIPLQYTELGEVRRKILEEAQTKKDKSKSKKEKGVKESAKRIIAIQSTKTTT